MTYLSLFTRSQLLLVSAVLCGCAPPAQQSTPTPDSSAASQRATGAPETEPDFSRTAAGTVGGLEFEVEGALLENGILTLRQGSDFFADRQIIIFLFTPPGELPDGRTWQTSADSGYVAGKPHVHTSWKQTDTDSSESASHTDGFDLRLELDDEATLEPGSRRSVTGRIQLSIPTENTQVVGRFDAEVGGFVLDDGIPDRRLDSPQLLCFLGTEAAQTEYGQKVQNISDRYSRAVLPEDEPKYGQCDLRTELTDGTVVFERAVFIKPTQEWELHARTNAFTIQWKSPLNPPDPTDSWSTMPKQIATWFENHWQDLDSQATGLFDFGIEGLGTNDQVRLAKATGKVRTQWKGDPHKRRFLFRLDEAGHWQLDRLLEEVEKVDFRTGTVVRSAR